MQRKASLLACGLAFLLVSGCTGRVAVHSTKIADTGLTVELRGPDEKNHYRYSIVEDGRVVAHRSLGPAQVDDAENPNIFVRENGIALISWGEGAAAAFAKIDTKERMVIENTNQANPTNEPFEIEADPG